MRGEGESKEVHCCVLGNMERDGKMVFLKKLHECYDVLGMCEEH